MVKCWCGCDDVEPFSDAYVRCKHCKTLISLQTADVKKEVEKSSLDNDALYGADYWKKHMLEMAHVETLDEYADMYLNGRAAYWMNCVLKYKLGHGKAIEIASGLGQMSYLLKNAGFDVTAMELSQEICDWIHAKMFVPVQAGEFVEEKDKYDLIIANDLLEHLTDPVSWVAAVSNSLKKDGVLVIQTPCYDGTSSYQEMVDSNARFLLLMIPDEHLYLFTKDSLKELFARFGLNVEFEDAYFGNNYDMFSFSSKTKLRVNTKKSIDEYLYSYPEGRLLKVMLEVFSEKKVLEREKHELEKRLIHYDKDVKFLNKAVEDERDEVEKQKKELEGLKDYPFLNGMLTNEKRRRLYTYIAQYESDPKAIRKAISLLEKHRECNNDITQDDVKLLLEYSKKYIDLLSLIRG